jgi:HNH endonuclease
MPESLGQVIRAMAQGRCEYCRMPQSEYRFRFVMDHIIARQHGGLTEMTNLALCCGPCNLFKGPNLAGIDPASGQMARLFNPRTDRWPEHFRYEDAVLVGLTPTGGATVAVLAINLPLRIAARRALIDIGVTFRFD